MGEKITPFHKAIVIAIMAIFFYSFLVIITSCTDFRPTGCLSELRTAVENADTLYFVNSGSVDSLEVITGSFMHYGFTVRKTTLTGKPGANFDYEGVCWPLHKPYKESSMDTAVAREIFETLHTYKNRRPMSAILFLIVISKQHSLFYI